jgi:hypothetical protein
MADIDELKAAFEQHIQTLNTHNLDAFVATVHDGVTGFTIASPFAQFIAVCSGLKTQL